MFEKVTVSDEKINRREYTHIISINLIVEQALSKHGKAEMPF